MSTRFTECFSTIPDPRIERRKLHLLEDIIGLAVIAVICGAEGWEAIEEFGKAKYKFLKRVLSLPEGIPSHDTMERVFNRIDPGAFSKTFIGFTDILNNKTEGEVISFDGKAMRGSQNRINGKGPLYMVSAWAGDNELVLGQFKVDEKSNEITAIPKLLELLDIEGCVVTIDAMGCQKDIARKVIDTGADYILALKGNQGELHGDVINAFEKRACDDVVEKIDAGHGRIETRKCSVISQIDLLDGKEHWAELASIVKVESKREFKNTDKVTEDTRYYIASLNKDASYFNDAVRQHWGIENKLHWVLDVQMGEDHSRKRKPLAAENFSTVRKIALNLIRQHKVGRMGIQNRRLKAGWDNKYLMKLLKF